MEESILCWALEIYFMIGIITAIVCTYCIKDIKVEEFIYISLWWPVLFAMYLVNVIYSKFGN